MFYIPDFTGSDDKWQPIILFADATEAIMFGFPNVHHYVLLSYYVTQYRKIHESTSGSSRMMTSMFYRLVPMRKKLGRIAFVLSKMGLSHRSTYYCSDKLLPHTIWIMKNRDWYDRVALGDLSANNDIESKD